MTMPFESLLECSVCLELLTERHKVLPCQHTFCTQCLEDISWRNKGELRCPECRTLVLMPIANLPTNIILNRILGTMAAVSSQKSAEVQNVPVPFFQPPVPSPEVVKPFMAPYPVIWQGQLCLKSDVAKVKLHYLSGFKELAQSVFQSFGDLSSDSSKTWINTSDVIPTQKTDSSVVTIGHLMKNDVELLTVLKCRMLQPRDYCVLLALPSGKDTSETEVESHQLNSNFISEFRKSDSSGLIHLNLAEGQRSAMLHFFHWNDLSDNILSEVAADIVPFIKTSQHLLVVISRVTLPRTWYSCSGDVSKCSLSSSRLIPTPIMKGILNGTGLYCPYNNIVGNLSTNPFVTQPLAPEIPPGASSLLTPESPQPVLPPKCSAFSSTPPFIPPKTILSPAISPKLPQLPSSSSPALNAAGKSNGAMRMPEPLSRPPKLDMRQQHQSPSRPSKEVYHQVYRALYDYQPLKADELRLQKGELYIVIEKCEDGWFKGSSLNTLKTGVFPGNYMQHVRDERSETSASSTTTTSVTPLAPTKTSSTVTPRAKASTSKLDSKIWEDVSNEAKGGDLIDFTSEFMESSRLNQVYRPPPNVTWNNQAELKDEFRIQPSEALLQPAEIAAAPSKNKSKAFKPAPPVAVLVPKYPSYIAIQEFPSSSDFELELRIGDVIKMMTVRDDGWCKGYHERTGKTGLFPRTFVTKKDST